MRQKLILAMLGLLVTNAAYAVVGPFAPAAGQVGSTALSKDSSLITNWATGYQNYVQGADLDAQWATPEKALGKATGVSTDVVSLGNGGSITMTFGGSIFNGAGNDFSIFENSFSDTFLELAFVEVSSDGINFFRFPTVSYTPSAVGAFGNIDPTYIDGFAGKYRAGFGTSFDLDLLKGTVGLDINNVGYVRLVDVWGDGRELDNATAAQGGPHKIYDPYKTTGSAGFDLEAVGVMNFTQIAAVPETETYAMMLMGLGVFGLIARRRQKQAQ